MTVATVGQDVESLLEMAGQKIEQGDLQYAGTIIDKAIALDSTDHWLWLTKAELLFEAYGTPEAMEAVMKAQEIAPDSSEVYNFAGLFLGSGGFTDSAIIMYNQAIALAQNDTLKHSYILNRGWAKMGHRDFDGARVDYNTVLDFDPNNIAALNNLGMIYQELRQNELTIKTLKRIIAIDSASGFSYANLGFTYANMDSLDLAIRYLNQALEMGVDESMVLNNRGYAYYRKKDYQQALEDINASIAGYPTNAYAYRNLALVYIDLEQFDEACRTLQYALYYGYTSRYGDDVEQLVKTHCESE
ncbi:MAG: tetratricopeptide repeat protein [Bacteroidota bacterium]